MKKANGWVMRVLLLLFHRINQQISNMLWYGNNMAKRYRM